MQLLSGKVFSQEPSQYIILRISGCSISIRGQVTSYWAHTRLRFANVLGLRLTYAFWNELCFLQMEKIPALCLVLALVIPAHILGEALGNPAFAPDFELLDIDTLGEGDGTGSMVLGADGYPVFSYSKSANLKTCLWVAKCTDAKCAGSIIRTQVDSSESLNKRAEPRTMVGKYSDIKIGSDGFPIVSYFDAWANTLKVLHCGNSACSEKNSFRVLMNQEGPEAYVYATSLQIGTNGLPRILFLNSDSNVVLATCLTPTCSTGAQASRPIKFARSTMPSFLIQANGFPQLIGMGINGGGGGLAFEKCDDANCAGMDHVPLSNNLAPQMSSLKTGPDGFPVIAFMEYFSRALIVVKCLDAYCVDPDQKTVAYVDTSAANSWMPSMALTSSGHPIIAYQSFERVLKIAFCSDVSCSAKTSYIPTTITTTSSLEPISTVVAPNGSIYVGFTSGKRVRAIHFASNPAALRKSDTRPTTLPAKSRFRGRTIQGRRATL